MSRKERSKTARKNRQSRKLEYAADCFEVVQDAATGKINLAEAAERVNRLASWHMNKQRKLTGKLQTKTARIAVLRKFVAEEACAMLAGQHGCPVEYGKCESVPDCPGTPSDCQPSAVTQCWMSAFRKPAGERLERLRGDWFSESD